jgi:hypothetical protein
MAACIAELFANGAVFFWVVVFACRNEIILAEIAPRFYIP